MRIEEGCVPNLYIALGTNGTDCSAVALRSAANNNTAVNEQPGFCPNKCKSTVRPRKESLEKERIICTFASSSNVNTPPEPMFPHPVMVLSSSLNIPCCPI
eukprot:PhM_4_TR1336/c2_g1_i1/m.48744